MPGYFAACDPKRTGVSGVKIELSIIKSEEGASKKDEA